MSLQEEAEALGIKVDKRWGEARLLEEIAKASEEPIAQPDDQAEYIQERAMAQWAGQSVSLPIHERKRRIVNAIKAKGLDPEGIRWPV